jgi:hypothetical protein
VPKLEWFGATVTRLRPLLDAIGAQEALEAHGAVRLGTVSRGVAWERAMERERSALARRRNATEARLRPEEHAAWCRWRAADPATRAAAYAMLADPPPSG